jgi:hypothetical protein
MGVENLTRNVPDLRKLKNSHTKDRMELAKAANARYQRPGEVSLPLEEEYDGPDDRQAALEGLDDEFFDPTLED